LAAAAIDGRLYAVGGRIDGNYSRNLASNEAYDPATKRWEQRAPMPTARSGIAAAVLEGRAFVFGGEAPARSGNRQNLAKGEYSPKHNKRAALGKLWTPKQTRGERLLATAKPVSSPRAFTPADAA
jgi:N-acetylneuraminic acid mutarotase